MTPTRAQLLAIAPQAKSAAVDLIDAILADWQLAIAAGVATPRIAAHFVAQLCVETDGLTRVEENLNYSARRIMQVWPSRFASIDVAGMYANRPQALANKVYGGRLGNNKPGDGWLYRGGGMLQTTGRDNYRKMGFEQNPEALRTPPVAFRTAVREWERRGCNAMAARDDLKGVRRAINGGLIGLDDAQVYLTRAKKVLGA